MNTARPTLTKVAEATGYSPSTVSRALRGDHRVADRTRDEILQAARTMGFRQNHMARALRLGGAASLLGVVVPDIRDPFFAAIATGIQTAASARGHQVILGSHGDDPDVQDRLVEQMMAHRVSALMVAPAPGCDPVPLRQELAFGTPLVLLDRPVAGLECDMLTTENTRGAAELATALLDRGHRNIAVVTLAGDVWTQAERLAGVRTALADRGLDLPSAHVAQDGAPGSLGAAVKRMLAGPDAPTALLSLSVPPLLSALLTGLVPDGVELASFDAHPLYDLLPMPVLCLEQDTAAIGRVAVERALGRLDDPSSPARTIELPLSTLHTRGGRDHRG